MRPEAGGSRANFACSNPDDYLGVPHCDQHVRQIETHPPASVGPIWGHQNRPAGDGVTGVKWGFRPVDLRPKYGIRFRRSPTTTLVPSIAGRI